MEHIEYTEGREREGREAFGRLIDLANQEEESLQQLDWEQEIAPIINRVAQDWLPSAVGRFDSPPLNRRTTLLVLLTCSTAAQDESVTNCHESTSYVVINVVLVVSVFMTVSYIVNRLWGK